MLDTPDITVTSATQSTDAMRERHDPKPEPTEPLAAAPPPAPDAPVADPDAAERDKTLDTLEPPTKPNETDAERVERRTRAERRIDKLTAKNKTAEERATAAERRAEELEQKLRQQAQPPAPAPAAPPAASPAASATASAPTDAPKFEFPDFDKWQETNPDGSYEQYGDARQDARYSWNKRVDQEQTAKAAEATERRQKQQEATAAIDAFKKEHADFDDVIKSFTIPGLEVDERGQVIAAPPTYSHVSELLAEAGKDKPALIYYLASHHEDANALFGAANPKQLLMRWGAIETKALAAPSQSAKASTAAEPPALPPSKPSTDAPAPVTGVKGGAVTTRTLEAVAADGEDADAYIARRNPDMAKALGISG